MKLKLLTKHAGIDFKMLLFGASWGTFFFSDSQSRCLDLWLHFFPFFLHLEFQLFTKKRNNIINFPVYIPDRNNHNHN